MSDEVIPSRVRVVGIDFPIVVRSADADTALDELYGYIDHMRGQIVLNGQNSSEQARECVVHEILHAVEHATRTDVSEEVIGRFGRALFAVIRDNPEVMAWLQSKPEAQPELTSDCQSATMFNQLCSEFSAICKALGVLPSEDPVRVAVQLKADQARLDWLEKNHASFYNHTRLPDVITSDTVGIRQAIDEAIRKGV